LKRMGPRTEPWGYHKKGVRSERQGRETGCNNCEGTRSKIRGEPVECSDGDAKLNGESMYEYSVVNGIECNRKVKDSKTCDLFEGDGIDDMIVNGKKSSLSRMMFCVG
jgi:hypothetical protein